MDLGVGRRRAAAGERGGVDRCRAGGDRGGHRALARSVTGFHAADRRRALLAVLGDPRADDRRRRDRPGRRRQDAHPPLRDPRRGGVLPGEVRPQAGRIRRGPGLARAGRLVRARRLADPAGHCPVRLHRHRGRTLPDLERPPRIRDRAGRRHARGGSAGGTGRRRVGLQRIGSDGRRTAPGIAGRPAPRRIDIHERPAGALGGDDGRRPRSRPAGRPRARWRSASSPTSRCGGSTGSPGSTSPTRSAR